ncbi:serine-rich adhesin for platelets isoform X2 [Drosophila montana]|uniref:serine-rich adhesin for platelets isoform X2 n=1 Tax=Drosophila montana TaxID=40370 RepID=UPI00313D83A5
MPNSQNDGFELPATHGICKTDGSCISQHRNSNSGNNCSSSGGHVRVTELASGAMECLPLSGGGGGGVVTHHPHLMAASAAGGTVVASPTATVVVGATYPHHLHHHHHLSHHAPYSNSYGSHPHHPIHSEQTKSLQELQHEVGALLEFRDLVIETFPDLKHKMASMSATPSTPSSVGALGGSHSVGGGSGGGGSSSLAARREWEPGIRMKRKLSHKEPSTTTAAAAASAGAEPSSSSLTRSRSNSHSGKKEPKSGENNNGSVVQDSGFSTETSSSKEGHSASSTNGAMTVAIASNRLSCAESDDELLNLLDVIHRKSNRLREEVEQLQSYERQQGDAAKGAKNGSGMTPQQFREQVERLNREDIKQLRKERDRLLDKLAEMEAETLTGRIKAAKMNDQVEELISVKKDLEEQLKLAMAQKLELSSRVQQLQLQQQQQQQQQQQSKSSSSASQSELSSQRNFLSSATTVLSNSSRPSLSSNNTFQPVVLDQQQQQPTPEAFHQSSGSDTAIAAARRQQQQQLGRLDGVVSTPGARNTKCRITDSKRFTAILLETNVLELQRHLLTLTVQNQVLAQKLDSSSKSKSLLTKRLDKSVEDTEELRFQLEEKNIELEGTKAQLRVLESRLHGSSSTNSYLNSSSQHDYETNRSSASTTLMLSRRGVPDSVDSASTSVSAAMPRSDQISTPSMKAMVPLAMEELQQHSSSTESAHEHEPERTPNDSTQSKTMVNISPSPLGSSTPTAAASSSSIAARVMSSSVGGVSPFEQTPLRSHAFRKFNSASKPSKIPLPGSKAAAYFAGKPPTGRPSTAGRSPPSVHNSSSVSYGSSSKSSLSRSTGNLSQSLKRGDSASNHSLSTNTSRSSTSSSIPLATTPYSSSSAGGNRSSHTATTTPSPRVLQNSPLPKLKRETLSSRVRHLDSLSRAQQSPEQHQQQLNNSSSSGSGGGASHKSAQMSTSGSSNSIAAQLSTTLRKDLQLNATTGPSYQRRAAAVGSSGPAVVRRFSSASVGSARLAREREQSNDPMATPTSSYGDSDSGKNLANFIRKPNFRFNNNNWHLWQTSNNNNKNNNRHNVVLMEPLTYIKELPSDEADVSEETAYDSYYTQYTTPDSMDCGSDNLLVTFDYGYSDSIGAPPMPAPAFAEDDHGADGECAIWFGTPPNDANAFKVHHVQHKPQLLEESLQSLISYDVDDFEEQSESESEQEQAQDPNADKAEFFYDSIECCT